MNKKLIAILLSLSFLSSRNIFGLFDDTRTKLAGIGSKITSPFKTAGSKISGAKAAIASRARILGIGDVKMSDIERVKRSASQKQNKLQTEITSIPDLEMRRTFEAMVESIKSRMKDLKYKSEQQMRNIQRELNIEDNSIDAIKLMLVWLQEHYNVVEKLMDLERDAIKASKKILPIVREDSYMSRMNKVFLNFKQKQRALEAKVGKRVLREGPKAIAYQGAPVTSFVGPDAYRVYFKDRKMVYNGVLSTEANIFRDLWEAIRGPLSARDQKRLIDQYRKDIQLARSRIFGKNLFEKWKSNWERHIRNIIQSGSGMEGPENAFWAMIDQTQQIHATARQKVEMNAGRTPTFAAPLPPEKEFMPSMPMAPGPMPITTQLTSLETIWNQFQQAGLMKPFSRYFTARRNDLRKLGQEQIFTSWRDSISSQYSNLMNRISRTMPKDRNQMKSEILGAWQLADMVLNNRIGEMPSTGTITQIPQVYLEESEMAMLEGEEPLTYEKYEGELQMPGAAYGERFKVDLPSTEEVITPPTGPPAPPAPPFPTRPTAGVPTPPPPPPFPAAGGAKPLATPAKTTATKPKMKIKAPTIDRANREIQDVVNALKSDVRYQDMDAVKAGHIAIANVLKKFEDSSEKRNLEINLQALFGINIGYKDPDKIKYIVKSKDGKLSVEEATPENIKLATQPSQTGQQTAQATKKTTTPALVSPMLQQRLQARTSEGFEEDDY